MNRSFCLISLVIIFLTSVMHKNAQDSLNVRQTTLLDDYWDRTRNLVVDETYAFVAAGSSGFRILDVSNNTSIQKVISIPTSGVCYDVARRNSVLLVAKGRDGLKILNSEDPSHPIIISRFQTSGSIMGVDIADELAYLVDDVNGLIIVDISTPDSPEEVGSFQAQSDVVSVDVSDSYAYLSTKFSGLRVLDISSASSPTEIGYYDEPGIYGESACLAAPPISDWIMA